MKLAAIFTVVATSALAAETQMVPRGVFMVDVGYMKSSLDSQWNNRAMKESLLPPIDRYEPGGGLQGRITARPEVSFNVLMLQAAYGITDDITAALIIPWILSTTVDTNMGWIQGDYQPQLGRPYSEDDFWGWAGSMGQAKPPARWVGNRNVPADIVLGARYRLHRYAFFADRGLESTLGLQIALPTGRPQDREEIISVGTNVWDLHAYGDAEIHYALAKGFFHSAEDEVSRVMLTGDVFYALLRPRVYETPRGEKNPLLMNFAPYVGDTYVIDPGDWVGGTATLELVPLVGPFAPLIAEKLWPAGGRGLPPLLQLTLSYTHVRTGQTDWRSNSPLWEWDREQYWRPGYKNLLRAHATVSLLRFGLPLQLYVNARTQTLIPGKNVRPADTATAGIRVIGKF